MNPMHEDILKNAVESSQQRVDQAKYGINQCHASVKYPVAGGGDQTDSNSAALIVAETKLVGAEAELDAITAAYESAKKGAHQAPKESAEKKANATVKNG